MQRSSSLSDALASPAEQTLLEALRAELAAELREAPQYPELVGDGRLLRTLRGFEHEVEAAAEAFRDHLAARRAWGLDAIREKIVSSCGDRLWQLRCEDLPYGEELSLYLPEVVIFARGRTGDPVSLGLWGKQRVSEFMKEVTDWRHKFMQYALSMMEAKALLLDRASEEQGRLVHFANVLDLENWSAVGNADRAWTEFVTETSGPVLQTYHEFNSYIFAIRTTRWARMAYSMIEPMLPQKVRDKIFLLGDAFHASAELSQMLQEGKIEQLKRRQFTVTPELQEGHVVIKRKDFFQLQVEVPDGATLTWAFRIEGQQCLQSCSVCQPPELMFSLVRCQGEGGAAVYKPVQGWESTKIGSGSASGRLDPTSNEHGPRLLALRWDNSHAWLSSRMLRYRVELELPSTQEAPDDWKASAKRYVFMVAANLAALGVAFAFDRFKGAF